MYDVGVVTQFEAAHRLVGDFGPAQRFHGHTYRVEATVTGNTLKADGTLFDIVLLQNALGAVINQLHYQNLDEIAGLNTRNTTAEVVAEYIWLAVAPALGQTGLVSLRIAVWESPNAWAGVTRALAQ